ncbi:MAG: hypothetical protein NC397_05935 [Clostridium sp.]|nr:hypothetical protein [Clostridium sp.]
MKKKDVFLLVFLLFAALLFVIFSPAAREGAYQGLVLAENTIIPSLLPLLIIFLFIMKSGAKDILAKSLGFIPACLFNLPRVAMPAIFFGLVGGYPTGAILTNELLQNEEIDIKQAQIMLRFNVCGGCGFIITAVGTGVLKSQRAGLILFASAVISNTIIGIVLSFFKKRTKNEYYSYTAEINAGDALTASVSGAVHSVLNLTAFIILFGSINAVLPLPDYIQPVLEITGGICGDSSFSLAEISGYLAFGGLCVHLQLLPILLQAKMKYWDFLLSRVIGALLSYAVTKLLCIIFPADVSVFSNTGEQLSAFSSINLSLSFLLVAGSVVLVLDISSRKRSLDK